MVDAASRQDPLADVITLLAAPIASGLRAVDQVRRGTEELLRTVDNLNSTLASLNETSQRVNALLAELEEPVRVAIPQLTRTIRTADEISQIVEGPLRTMAPALPAFAEAVSRTPIDAIPAQLSEVVNTIREMSSRMAPLAQLAENAGGLFGGLRLPGLGGGTRPPQRRPSSAPEPAASGGSGASSGRDSAAVASDAAQTAARTSAADPNEPQPRSKSAASKASAPAKKAANKRPAPKKAAKKRSAQPKAAKRSAPTSKSKGAARS